MIKPRIVTKKDKEQIERIKSKIDKIDELAGELKEGTIIASQVELAAIEMNTRTYQWDELEQVVDRILERVENFASIHSREH